MVTVYHIIYCVVFSVLLSRLLPYAKEIIRKLLGIINVAFDATGRLLIIYFAFAKYLRKNGNTMKKFIIS